MRATNEETDDASTRLLPDTPAAHAALGRARQLVRDGAYQEALATLSSPDCRETGLAGLLRADLLLAVGNPREAEALALELTKRYGDTGQGLLCAGQAALARGERELAKERFARAAAADPGRIAAQINAAALAPTPHSEAGTHSRGAIAAVTSLPPHVDDRHRAAVASFLAAGFDPVLSVNTPAEIEGLWRAFPKIAFVAGTETGQTALFGRPYAALPDLLAAGAATGAAVVTLLNADITLTPFPGWAAMLAAAAQGGAVTACRVDVETLPGTDGVYYDVGFDGCAVATALLKDLDLTGWYLGLPWWDYALPLAVAAAGGKLGFCPTPALRHRRHATAWSNRHFVRLGRRFVRRFFPQTTEFLFPEGETFADGQAERSLGGVGVRVAAAIRRAGPVTLGPVGAFCPHDPAFAAALLPLTPVRFSRD